MFLNTFLQCTGVHKHFSADLTWSANIFLQFHLDVYWQTPENSSPPSFFWDSPSVRRQSCWYSSFEPSIISGSLDQRPEPWSLWKLSSGHTSKQEEERKGNKKEQGGKCIRTQSFVFSRHFSVMFHAKLLLKFIADICRQSSMKKPRQVGISVFKMPLFH